MLTSAYRHSQDSADLDSIHNYYERMVLEEIHRTLPERREARGLLADIACVALNHLPPRYIRHDVDMAFYLSPREQMEMEDKVRDAVQHAIAFVDARSGGDGRDTPSAAIDDEA